QLVVLQKAAGLEPVVLTGSERRSTTDQAREDLGGVPVVRLFRREEERFSVLFRPARVLEVARRVAAELGPDLGPVHHWFNLGDTLLQSLDLKVPVVATFHDAYAHCPRFFFLRPDGFYCGGALPIERQRCVDCVRIDDGDADLEARIAERRASF